MRNTGQHVLLRIDPVVREVDEMDRIAQQQIIRLRRRIELRPQTFTSASATFGGEHDVGSMRMRGGSLFYCKLDRDAEFWVVLFGVVSQAR